MLTFLPLDKLSEIQDKNLVGIGNFLTLGEKMGEYTLPHFLIQYFLPAGIIHA